MAAEAAVAIIASFMVAEVEAVNLMELSQKIRMSTLRKRLEQYEAPLKI